MRCSVSYQSAFYGAAGGFGLDFVLSRDLKMPRKGKRRRVLKGCYEDSSGIEVRIVVGGEIYSERMPLDSTKAELQAKHAELKDRGHRETPASQRGTLAADTKRYLKLVAHLASAKERRAHLEAWCKRLAETGRHRITASDVLAARVAWLKQKPPLAPKTINHRVDTLRHLYRTLDGKKAATPCDDVAPLHVPKTPIQRVPDALILKVDQALQVMEQRRDAPPWDAKTRARFRVFVSTGKRPCEIMRAEPSDVNLEARVWVPRDAKGGFCPGVYLNDDMLAAWQLFIEAKAWGRYSTGNFARTLRSAGWPEKLRPYQARHTFGITLSEAGVDLQDVSTAMGHRDVRTTRKSYVPVLNSRLQRLSETVAGRFSGWSVAPESDPDAKPLTDKT